jgi:hypothetical protein
MRFSLLLALASAMILPLTGCLFNSSPASRSTQTLICFDGMTRPVNPGALRYHLQNGATEGACNEL